MSIVIPDEMEAAYVDAAYAAHEQVTASVAAGLEAALESGTPEAKRDLAAQLLRSASTQEGYDSAP